MQIIKKRIFFVFNRLKEEDFLTPQTLTSTPCSLHRALRTLHTLLSLKSSLILAHHKTPNITKGYKNNPEANKAAFSFGWFHTGDVGYLDSDGYLHLVGRIKELINRGGIDFNRSSLLASHICLYLCLCLSLWTDEMGCFKIFRGEDIAN